LLKALKVSLFYRGFGVYLHTLYIFIKEISTRLWNLLFALPKINNKDDFFSVSEHPKHVFEKSFDGPLSETDLELEKHDHVFKHLCLGALGRQANQLRSLYVIIWSLFLS